MNEPVPAHFRSKETQMGFFIPHARCAGWFITNITGYFVRESSDPIRNSLSKSVETGLWKRAFARYRLYYRGKKVFVSVPEKDLDHFCEALYCFELTKPTTRQSHVVQVDVEHDPIHKDVHCLIAEYILHESIMRARVVRGSRHPEERVFANYAFDMAIHIATRLIMDLPMIRLRDTVVRGILHSQVTGAAPRDEKAWIVYNNIWHLSDEINRLSPRPADDKNAILSKFFPATRQQFRKIKKTKLSLKDVPSDAEMEKFFLTLPNDVLTSNTQLFYNYQVRKGYGLFAASSATYPNWKAEKKEEDENKQENQEEQKDEDKEDEEDDVHSGKELENENKNENESSK